jgi:UDP-N-acetylmuramoyl-L-alanyl-D-glutamate--2,6-diaminopimelate ligase
MRLSVLAGENFAVDPDIAGLTSDSRAVAQGFLFAALPGEKFDGAEFIPQAEENGAAAILAQPGTRTILPLVADDDPRKRLSAMAARFYPRQPEIIAGITGTNGKTSTAHFAAQLWSRLGRKGGSLGTLGGSADGLHIDTGLTTPEPVKLHTTLDEMARAGVDRLAMEVSSHALVQARADGVAFKIAAFTNITQDHLDYHADFEDYFAAKARLFNALLPTDGVAVINAGGDGARLMIEAARARSASVMTTGAGGDDLKLISTAPSLNGIDIAVEADGDTFNVCLPLIGLFQAENALLAAGIVIAAGEPTQKVLPLLSELSGVPGRMQYAAAVNGASVYVDYAHTPDAITTALDAIGPHARKVIAIIGAGGDRDNAKRPKMGAAAAENASAVIVTDDNPRTEDPAEIRRHVLAQAPTAIEIADRGEAISLGVSMLEPGDILLIMGKGHETGQQVGDEVLPFDDVEVARKAADERRRELGRS